MRGGFTLIELTIAMILAGVLIAGLITVMRGQLQMQEMERLRATDNNIQRLVEEIEKYRATHGHLPCPASLSAPMDDERFGRPVTNNCPVGNHAGTYRVSGTNGRVVRIGAVPVRALNIEAQRSFDHWSNRLTYAVTADQASGGTVPPTDHGAIDVRDESGASAVIPTGSAHYVIVSHGPSGQGAYSVAGNLTPCDTGARDAENCNRSNARFLSASLSRAEGGYFFDDVVAFAGPPAPTIPKDAVMAFDLEECPPGWSNMSEVSGRVIVGTGSLAGDNYSLGDSGGAAHYALSVNEIPPHRHGFKLQYSSQPVPTPNVWAGPQPDASLRRQYTNQYWPPACPDCDEDDPESIYTDRWRSRVVFAGHPSTGRYRVDLPSSYNQSVGGGEAFDNRPPYHALLYCRKD